MVPDIASISFKLAQLTVKSEQPNFGPFSPHFAETTSSSTDLSTLVHSCAPFDTITSRSGRQDHFGSDFRGHPGRHALCLAQPTSLFSLVVIV